MPDHIERIVLEADEEDAVASTKRANTELTNYERIGTRANKNVGNAIGETNKQLDVHERRLMIVARAQGSAATESARSAKEEAKLAAVHQTAANAANSFWNATKELISGLSASAGVYAAHGVVTEKLVSSYRALRLVFSPTIFTGVTIAAGIFIETIAKLIVAQDKLIQQDAIIAAKRNVSSQTASQFRLAGANTGQSTSELVDAFKKIAPSDLDKLDISATNAAGSMKTAAEILGETLKTLGAISDPSERVRKTFEVFGAEVGEKILPHLNSRLLENAKFIRDWSVEMPDATKAAVNEAATDIRSLGTIFDTLGDKIHLALIRAKDRTIADFADLYVAVKRGAKAISEIDAGATSGTFGGSLATINTSVAGPEAAVEKARERIAALGPSANVTALGLDSKALSGKVQSIVQDRSKALDILEKELTSEKERLSKLLGSSRDTAKSGSVNNALLDQQIVLSDARVKGLQKEVDASKAAADAKTAAQQKIENAEKRAHEVLIQAQKGEYTGLADIIAEYGVYRRELGLSEKANLDLAKAVQLRLRTEATKELKKNAGETVKDLEQGLQDDLSFRQLKFQRDQQFSQETLNLQIDTLDKIFEYEQTTIQQTRDARLLALEGVNAQTLSQHIAVAGKRLSIEEDYYAKLAVLETEQIERRRDREIAFQRGLADLKLITEQQFQERQSALIDAAYQATARATQNSQAQIEGAQQTAANRTIQLVHDANTKLFESIKHSAEGVLGSDVDAQSERVPGNRECFQIGVSDGHQGNRILADRSHVHEVAHRAIGWIGGRRQHGGRFVREDRRHPRVSRSRICPGIRRRWL
jgi:hypothetical protein